MAVHPTEPASMIGRPLEGIRVIDYSHFLAGPYLSRCLAAMGADVIKVERPHAGDASRRSPYVRDGYSGYFMQQNLGKRGLCLDLKDARGAELFGRLLDTADVFEAADLACAKIQTIDDVVADPQTEHNTELAAELGYTETDIRELFADGVLYTQSATDLDGDGAGDAGPETS